MINNNKASTTTNNIFKSNCDILSSAATLASTTESILDSSMLKAQKQLSMNKSINLDTNSTNITTTTTTTTLFELSEPFKSKHLVKLKTTTLLDDKNKNNEFNLLFKFNEPIRLKSNLNYLNSNNQDTNSSKTVQRNHVIVVEQAPFSVFKSVKSQEHIDQDKLNNNVVVINSLRNHPYNNSIRPTNINSKENNIVQESALSTSTSSITTTFNSNLTNSNTTSSITITPLQNTFTTTNTNTLVDSANQVLTSTPSQVPSQTKQQNLQESTINKPVQTNDIDNSSNSQNKPPTQSTTCTSQAAKTLNRNSSSNAILAQMKSLGPNFKSIFVRPKNSKHIDPSLIFDKPKHHAKNLFENSSSFNRLLGTARSSIYSSNLDTTRNLDETSSKLFSNINRILPNIEPKELKLNQSVNDLLKKFATENDILSKTIKNISNLSSSSPARSSSSTPTSSLSLSPLTKFTGADQLIANKSKSSKTKDELNSTISSVSSNNTEKWTCMICLSKHTDRIDICSICGSSKPDQNSKKPSSASISFAKHYSSNKPPQQPFSTYLFNELGLNRNQNLLRISTDSAEHMEYKQYDPDEVSRKLLLVSPKSNPYLKKWTCIHCNYSNDSLKVVCWNCRWVKTSTTKAKTAQQLNESIRSPSKAQLDKLTNQEPDESSPAKRTKTTEPTVCSSCKTNIQEEEKKESFPKTSPKWTCDSCLVPNESSKEKCVCCGAQKPKETTKTEKPTNNVDIFKAKPSNKWPCPTCLTNNDLDKLKCPCCQTDKPGALPPLTKPPNKWSCSLCMANNEQDQIKCACCQTQKPGSQTKPLIQSQPTLVLPQTSITPSTSIKFGLSSTDSNKPISFGSQSSTSSQESGGFRISFGSSNSTAPLFKLGSSSEPEKKKLDLDTLFSFAKPAENKETPLFASKPEEKKETPLFGTKPEEKKENTPTFAPINFGQPAKPEEKKEITFLGSGFSKPEEKKDTALTFAPTNFGQASKPEEKKETSIFGSLGSIFPKPEEKKENSLFGGLVTESKPLIETKSFGSLIKPEEKKEGDFLNVFGSNTTPVISFSKPVPTEPAKETPKTTFGGFAATPGSTPSIVPFKFGSNTTNTTDTTTSLFSSTPSLSTSSNQLKSFNLFGTTPSTSTTPSPAKPLVENAAPSASSSQTPVFGASFGSSFGTTTQATPSTGLNSVSTSFFGTQTPAGKAQTENKLFGSTTAPSSFGTAQPTLSFGQSQPSLFSSSTNSIFGQTKPAESSTATTTTPFQFGSFNSPPTTTPASSVTSTNTPQTTSFFGNSTPQTTTNTSQPFSLFPSNPSTTTTTTSGFNSMQTPQATNLFGAPTPNSSIASTTTNPTPFNFNLTPNLNFGQTNQTSNGIILFSGNSAEQGANADTGARKMRKAVRRYK